MLTGFSFSHFGGNEKCQESPDGVNSNYISCILYYTIDIVYAI